MFEKRKPNAARRTPTVDGIKAPDSEFGPQLRRGAEGSEGDKYRYWSAFTLVVGLASPVVLGVEAVAWLAIAGEAGSPQPDNWAQLSRVLELIERSVLPLLAISIIAPCAWRASTQGKRWGLYPVPILLIVTLGLLFLL